MTKMLDKLLQFVRSIESLAGDYWLHINSSSPVYFEGKRGKNQDAFDFETISHGSIMRTIRMTKPGPNDVVYVLGCGKGRAACHFARCRVRKVVGVELSDSLADIARANAVTLKRPHAPIEIMCADATLVEIGDGTVIFMFNPFGEKTMRNVLGNVEKTHKANQKPLTIIYVNPVFAHVFDEARWLEKTFDYKRFTGQRTVIYRNCHMLSRTGKS